MSEIMIPDLSHPLRLEQLRKALSDVVGLYQIANLIDTYILKIVLDVTASAQATVLLLFFFQCKKSFPHGRNKRQCSHTRFRLCGVRRNQNALAVKITGSNRVTDGDCVLVKVDGIPFQTDSFTPAQTVERTEENRKLKLASFCSLEKSVTLNDVDGEIAELMYKTVRKLESMTDAEFEELYIMPDGMVDD